MNYGRTSKGHCHYGRFCLLVSGCLQTEDYRMAMTLENLSRICTSQQIGTASSERGLEGGLPYIVKKGKTIVKPAKLMEFKPQ